MAGLNAPYGARCFLTLPKGQERFTRELLGLNAPYGARCFLTRTRCSTYGRSHSVLMRLMVLDTF